jgi:hypothetical protein
LSFDTCHIASNGKCIVFPEFSTKASNLLTDLAAKATL